MLPEALPSQYDVRHGHFLRWDMVDFLLTKVEGHGELSRLAAELDISRSTLHARRRKLKLPPLPRGRALETEPTQLELDILRRVRAGETMTAIAKERGTTMQAVQNAMSRGEEKEEKKNGVCLRCFGAGTVACGKQKEDEYCAQSLRNITATNFSQKTTHKYQAHDHVCLKCGGNSKYPGCP